MAGSLRTTDAPINFGPSAAIGVIAQQANFGVNNVFSSPLENYTVHTGPFQSVEVNRMLRMAVFDELNEMAIDQSSSSGDGSSTTSRLDLNGDDELRVVDSLFDEFADSELAL